MRIAKTISQLLVTIVGIVLCSAAMLVLTAQHSAVDSVRATDAVAYRGMLNPGATLDTTQVDDLSGGDTAQQDAAAEGQDVLTLAYDPAPAPLWESLRILHPQWYDEGPGDVAGHGRFMVPVGTDVPVPGGLYRATLDGWSSCRDFVTFNGECSATGPVVPVDLSEVAPIQLVAHVADVNPYGAGGGAVCGTDAQCAAYSRSIGEAPTGYAALAHPAPHRFTAQERKAARLILARLTAHRHVEEDWTWMGMPRVVGAHNDALSRAAQAAGLHGNDWPWSATARTWLSQVVRTGKAGPVQSVQKA